MSPSWPDALYPQLTLAFAEQGYARSRPLLGKTATWHTTAGRLHDTPGLLAALDALLSAAPQPLKPGTRVALLLPDTLARYRLLPWAPVLTAADELAQYAVEHFELAGHPVREGWQVQAEWRGACDALAYALPHALLDAIDAALRERGLVLRRALPLAARLHYGRLRQPRSHHWSLLSSGGSLTALAYRNGHLAAQASEPLRDGHDDALQRLLARLRIAGGFAMPKRLDSIGLDPAILAKLLSDGAPSIQPIDPLTWKAR